MPAPFGFVGSIFSRTSASAASACSFVQSVLKRRTCFPLSVVTKPHALRFVRWPGTLQARCRTFAMSASLLLVRGSLLVDCASQSACERLDPNQRADGGFAPAGLHRGDQERSLVQQLTGGLEQRVVHGLSAGSAERRSRYRMT